MSIDGRARPRPTLVTDRTEPIDEIAPDEPMDRIDPVEPIERIDPADPMDKIDPAEPTDKREPTEPIGYVYAPLLKPSPPGGV